MTDRLRIALAQLNPTVGAIAQNLALARQTLADAAGQGADILLFSELFLTGYFPDDLLFKPRFIADAMAAAEDFARATAGTAVTAIMPTVWREGGKLFNAVIVCEAGVIVARRYKRELPNDDIFYEKRYFERADLQEPVTIKGVSIGIPICEDIWHPDVCAHLVDQGARILLCPNGSPYWRNKQATRYKLVTDRVAEDNVPLLYLNQVGGQDELVYDGASFGIEPGGRLVVQARSFEPEILMSNWARTPDGWRCTDPHVTPLSSVDEAPWRACVLG
ncbi:MAG: NAD+ synthase, partial [Devosia sp.]|nr:NAD+ synthase [Devosia sp.]